MAYTINLSDGVTVLGVIEDRTFERDLAPIVFIGRNTPGYGDALNENLAFLLENFRSTSAPEPVSVRGQFWMDPSGSPTDPVPPLTINGDVPRMKFNVSSDPQAPVWWEVAHAINGTIHAEAAVIGMLVTGTATIGSLSVASGITTTGEFNGTAARARYADLAERYAAHPEQDIHPGHVVELGGPAEIQLASSDATVAVFGVVSTRPGFLMNDAAGDDRTHPYIALAGRVPCAVLGPVRRGDRLVASEVPGTARARAPSDPIEAVFARALADGPETGLGTVEVVVAGVR